jgi:hypothetical protein
MLLTRKAGTLLYTQALALVSQMNLIRSTKRIAALIGVGIMAGCVSGPSAREVADANYGPLPSINYREVIRDHMDPTFFDWRSAQYKFTEPYPGWLRDPEELGGTVQFGYKVDVLINAKGAKGKYIGFEPYTFLFKDNQLIRERVPETGAKRSSRPYGE